MNELVHSNFNREQYVTVKAYTHQCIVLRPISPTFTTSPTPILSTDPPAIKTWFKEHHLHISICYNPLPLICDFNFKMSTNLPRLLDSPPPSFEILGTWEYKVVMCPKSFFIITSRSFYSCSKVFKLASCQIYAIDAHTL